MDAHLLRLDTLLQQAHLSAPDRAELLALFGTQERAHALVGALEAYGPRFAVHVLNNYRAKRNASADEGNASWRAVLEDEEAFLASLAATPTP